MRRSPCTPRTQSELQQLLNELEQVAGKSSRAKKELHEQQQRTEDLASRLQHLEDEASQLQSGETLVLALEKSQKGRTLDPEVTAMQVQLNGLRGQVVSQQKEQKALAGRLLEVMKIVPGAEVASSRFALELNEVEGSEEAERLQKLQLLQAESREQEREEQNAAQQLAQELTPREIQLAKLAPPSAVGGDRRDGLLKSLWVARLAPAPRFFFDEFGFAGDRDGAKVPSSGGPVPQGAACADQQDGHAEVAP